ncbi:YlbD family protein [Pseudoneobacillus rhizosphaerae]|uniref:Cytosolic protein n=1 Tax=Pseudoneobacillus rhizosphaerae TaxID=2880968 RepID=A0A9C7G9X9_9BACI|nr:YlbD family protein [Pseudoneobacillus rhizosphaerae]CAG9608674.1 hypothetical protein NEOCIP111885_02391 [Pseudoneobacillus rhizosphaerae]
MTRKKLHPSVVKFKEFVKQYPKISLEVKKGTVSWQELYEDWYLLGEDDARWDQFKVSKEEMKENSTEENKSDFITQIFDYFKTMDVNQMQQYISNASQALGAVQGVLSQFQNPTQPSSQNNSRPSHPFSFRKD